MKTALPADLELPSIINHKTFIGRYQTKRVDSIEFDVDTDPRVRAALGVSDEARPLARLRGENVHADGSLMGAIRGWQTYVYADAPIEVV